MLDGHDLIPARWLRSHTRYPYQTATPSLQGKSNSLMNRAIFYLYPWENIGGATRYPGVYKGICSVIGLFARSTIKNWRRGLTHPAPAVIETLARHMRSKAEQARVLADELEAYAAERRAADKRKIKKGVGVALGEKEV